MRMALIRDGVVVNVIEANPDFVPEDGAQIRPAAEAGPGWAYRDGSFVAPRESPPVPASVSMFQAREALRRTRRPTGETLLDVIDAHVTARRLDEPTLALAWEYATEVERRGVFVTTLAAAFDLDDDALDDLFRLAATIDA